MATQPPDDTPKKADAAPPAAEAKKPAAPPRKPLPAKKPAPPAPGADAEAKKGTGPEAPKKPAPAAPGAPVKKKPALEKTSPAGEAKADKPADAPAETSADKPAEDKKTPEGAVTTEPAPKKKKGDKADKANPADGAITGEPPAPKTEEGIVAGKDKDGVAVKPKRFAFTWPTFKPAAPTGVWGVDLGQCGLKAVRLEEIDGEIVATAFEYIEHPKILSQPDADPDELTRDALTKFLAQNKIAGDLVAISVPGQSGLARFVKLPPVEEKKIADIVRFEAKQQIPFNLDEVVWDYQKLGAGEVTDGLALDAEIGLFAMKRDAVNRYLQHFKDVKVEVHFVQMAPLALCNFLGYDVLKKAPGGGPAGEEGAEAPPAEDKGCVAALDIGADSSSLVVTDGERIIWQRPIPLGGNHFTRALSKELKLTFAKAEHLKRNATKSPDLKAILAALKPVLNDFVGEVQRSLNFFNGSHRSASIDYLIGLGNAFRLPGLQSYLKEKLQLNVVKLQKFERLSGATVVGDQRFSDNVLTFAVAYGLALQGLKRTRLQTNLLPSEIREERLIRAKKPMAVAAAALLLVGLGMLAFGSGMNVRPWKSEQVKNATTKAKNVVAAVKAADAKFEAARADARREEDAVNGLLAGQLEYSNWVQLDAFIRSCVPLADGSNLPAATEQSNPYQKYFLDPPTNVDERTALNQEPMSGFQAFQELRKVQLGQAKAQRPFRFSAAPPTTGTGNPMNPMPGVPGKGPVTSGPTTGPATGPRPGDPNSGALGSPGEEPLPRGIDDLVQVNLESIDARYVDDLEAVWKTVKTEDATGTQALPFKSDKKEKGWVVEVRGYTWNNGRVAFVKDAFLENLAQRGLPDKSDGKTPLPDRGPVLNRVSHFVLYTSVVHGGPNDPLGPLTIANRSFLEEAVQGGGAPAGPGGKTGAAAPAAGGRSAAGNRGSWNPVGGKFATAGAAGGSGLRGQPPRPAGTPADPSKDPENTPRAEGIQHRRTEFVILFFWREPTPSDVMRGQVDAPPAPPGAAPGANPGAAPPPRPGGAK